MGKASTLSHLPGDRRGLKHGGEHWEGSAAPPSRYHGIVQPFIASCLGYFNSLLTGPLSPFSPTFILCTTDNVIFLHHSLIKERASSVTQQRPPHPPVGCLRISGNWFTCPCLLCTLLLIHPSVPSCHLWATPRAADVGHSHRPPFIFAASSSSFSV